MKHTATRSVLQSLVSSLVRQPLDYGNATLAGVSSYQADAVGDKFCCSACYFYIEARPHNATLESWHSCTGWRYMLQSTFGLEGNVLAWIRSFHTDRTQRVSFDGRLSSIINLLFGVPRGQCSVLCCYCHTLLKCLTLSHPLHSLVIPMLMTHNNAPVSDSLLASTRLAEYEEQFDAWMSRNGLKLNADKTRLMWLGTRQQLDKLTVVQLPFCSSTVDMVSTATNLGVVLDSQLTMSKHTASICRSEFYQLRQLRSIQRSLTTDATRALVQAFISCKLDYCNSLLAGVAYVHLRRLQSAQNAAARWSRRPVVATTSDQSLRILTGYLFARE